MEVYIMKMMINIYLIEVVVIRGASKWESILQNSCSWKRSCPSGIFSLHSEYEEMSVLTL